MSRTDAWIPDTKRLRICADVISASFFVPKDAPRMRQVVVFNRAHIKMRLRRLRRWKGPA